MNKNALLQQAKIHFEKGLSLINAALQDNTAGHNPAPERANNRKPLPQQAVANKLEGRKRRRVLNSK